MSPHSLVKLLSHRFTIARAPKRGRAVYSLLHFSVGSPRLAVSQPAVLWCSDFPPAAPRYARFATGDHPVCSETFQARSI